MNLKLIPNQGTIWLFPTRPSTNTIARARFLSNKGFPGSKVKCFQFDLLIFNLKCERFTLQSVLKVENSQAYDMTVQSFSNLPLHY